MTDKFELMPCSPRIMEPVIARARYMPPLAEAGAQRYMLMTTDPRGNFVNVKVLHEANRRIARLTLRLRFLEAKLVELQSISHKTTKGE